jgi:putative ABC transport system substrate-binding protein
VEGPERYSQPSAELVSLQPDLIVCGLGEPGIVALKKATTTIPIVMLVAADPVGTGLVASLARPGSNVTGMSLLTPELGGKRLAMLKEAVATATRVVVLWNAAYPGKAAEFKEIVDYARRQRLPMIAELRQFAEAGALMSYGASLADLFRRAAGHVDKILRGSKPADLPVEQPTKFELVINLKAAKALGLTIPQTLLLQADQVIE